VGLDVSHGAFSGAYSSFNRFRRAIAKAIGGSFPPHDDKSLDEEQIYWPNGFTETNPGLAEFLLHSDCDGEISSLACKWIADEMEALLPALKTYGMGGGHLARDGGYEQVAKNFIAGCRYAHSEGEDLRFF